MPRQVQNVVVTIPEPGTAHIEIGPFGHDIAITDLFARTGSDLGPVRDNVRLAYQIGNYGNPCSTEFIRQVNKDGNGMEHVSGKIKLVDVSLVGTEPNNWHFSFAFTNGPHAGQELGIDIDENVLTFDDDNDTTVIRNIANWLAKEGYTSLTSAAIAGIAAAKFWK